MGLLIICVQQLPLAFCIFVIVYGFKFIEEYGCLSQKLQYLWLISLKNTHSYMETKNKNY
jgi:hypothetical protein